MKSLSVKELLSKVRRTTSVTLLLSVSVALLTGCTDRQPKSLREGLQPNKESRTEWTGKIKRVYSKDVGAGNIEIFADDDAGNTKRLTNSPGRDEAPTLSPDRTKIAFNSDRDGQPAVYLMDTQGNLLRRLDNLGPNDLISKESNWKDNEQLIVRETRGWRGYDTERGGRIYQLHRWYLNINTGGSSGWLVETYWEGTGELIEVKDFGSNQVIFKKW